MVCEYLDDDGYDRASMDTKDILLLRSHWIE